jgi:hypothetical protein
MNIEGWLKICTSHIVYSQILLHLPKDDHHFFYMLLLMISLRQHFKKILQKNTEINSQLTHNRIDTHTYRIMHTTIANFLLITYLLLLLFNFPLESVYCVQETALFTGWGAVLFFFNFVMATIHMEDLARCDVTILATIDRKIWPGLAMSQS